MVDENKDFALLELNEGKFALLNAEDGQILTRFSKGNERFESLTQPKATSDDYRWSLSFGENAVFLESAMNDSQLRRRFTYVDWDVLRARRVGTASDAETPTALFTPQTNGVSVVKVGDFTNEIRLVDAEQQITALSVTPDGNWVATGGDDSLIRIWDVKRRRCARTFIGHGGVVEALWIDPKGRFVLSITKGNVCQYWNVAILCRRSTKLRAPRLLCQINSSEELQERSERIDAILKDARDAEKKNDVRTLVRLFNDAKGIEGGEEARIFFERTLDRRAARSGVEEIAQASEIVAHESVLSTLALAWNGAFLATAGKDCAVRLWASEVKSVLNEDKIEAKRAESWTLVYELAHADWVRTIALSPNGRFLASGSWDQSVALWDLANGRRIARLPEKIRGVSKVCFAPDGRTLAVTTANGTVSLWSLVRSRELIRLPAGVGGVRAFVFSRDGRFFATCAEDKTIRIWNGRSKLPRKEIRNFPANVLTLDVSFNGTTLVAGCADGKIYVVDLTDDSEKTRRVISGHLGEVGVVKLFPESRWLVSTGKDKTVRIWDLQNLREVCNVRSVDGEIFDLALDLAGTALFTGSEKGVARKWAIRWNYEVPDASRDSSNLLATLNNFYLRAGEATERESSFLLYGDNFFETEKDRDEKTNYPPSIWNKSKAEAKYCGFVEP